MSIYTDIYQNVEFPLICTRGIIVFPNQEIVFDVGRSASIAAITAAKNLHDSFVVLLSQKDIMVEAVSVDNMYNFGSLCHIEFIRKEKDLYKVKVKSLARANINSITFDGSMYLANISVVDSYVTDKEEESIEVKNVIKECQMIFSELPNLPKDLFSQLTSTVDGEALSDNLGQFYPMELSSRQAILEQLDVNKRLILILQQFQLTRELKKIEDEISEKVKDSINDNQKEYYLREKLRAIKEELNEDDGDDSDSLLDQFMNNPYPDNIKEKAKEEIKRLEMMPSISSEASVIRSYLDWLSKVPYWQESQDNCDIKSIKEILDQDHYGIKKVKERILEYIAVKNMTGSLKAPILCLYGPPGVGKTSLAKSIARALNRKFVKISLGGVKDEAEIRGHRRTYLGSMPGRIIQGMKKATTINPVFLIDELDKMGMDYKGDPASAMLEVLDPEQNTMFSDNYLEEPYDLSKVMFIATANDISTIPAALRDRLEIIEMNSYTEEEKVHIAKEHLLAKELEANGLKASQFKLKEEEILYIIRYYTREAGVRQLQRCISNLCRKVVLDISQNDKKSVRITKKLINEYLGKEIYEFGRKEENDQVGIVTGLAYTQFGGDILPIEVTTYHGSGKLVVTGNLGDVMKESATIAVGYVKANSAKFNIAEDFFDKHDLQIHVPEGAVPKDGPSAGITLTTAIISSLTNRAVSNDLAMTGEVTLRGNVLAIGGLREKTMAAYRSNIHNIIIPHSNLKDLDEVEDVVKQNIKFIDVKTMDDVVKHALNN
ncbi:MAG: endopeptidase La [Erysipelotrichaceae bacterium]|nr:endopeptidase La [Erysipelotrichaceae bacterium]MDY5728401.1 endopeptidase La [Erysipelotrichaceae bacterium]